MVAAARDARRARKHPRRGFEELVSRIQEMGEALTEEDGSNEREHDYAYAVFEAAQALAPEIAAIVDKKPKGIACNWCDETIAPAATRVDHRRRRVPRWAPKTRH